jgi:uncharacterized protein with HEPN domain
MSPDDLIRLRHMAEAAEAAIAFSQGRSRADVDTDAMLRFALVHAVQIIGEAAAKVSAAGRAQAAAIDWPVIVAMRNRLVHAYFDLDAAILWRTVTTSLPMLLHQLRAVPGLRAGAGAQD